MKSNHVLLEGLFAIALLMIGADAGLARGSFSAGNPGGMRAGASYPLAPTPANQAWERNNAWANYKAQNIQIQGPNVSTGNAGSAPQPHPGTP